MRLWMALDGFGSIESSVSKDPSLQINLQNDMFKMKPEHCRMALLQKNPQSNGSHCIVIPLESCVVTFGDHVGWGFATAEPSSSLALEPPAPAQSAARAWTYECRLVAGRIGTVDRRGSNERVDMVWFGSMFCMLLIRLWDRLTLAYIQIRGGLQVSHLIW